MLDNLPVKIPELWLRMKCSMSDIGGEGHIVDQTIVVSQPNNIRDMNARNMEMATKGLRDFGVKVD